MPRHIRPSRACVEMVKAFEGYRRHAAQAPDGAWTLGYGHTVSARAGTEVDEADAEALLLFDLRRTAEGVSAVVFAPLTQNQADALVAFAFNIGLPNFGRSAVLQRLNEGDALGAAHALERWRQAAWAGSDQVIDALVRRRAAEKALFLTPPDGFPAAPTPVLKPLFDPHGGDPVDARAGRATEAHVSLDDVAAIQPLADIARDDAVSAPEPEFSPATMAAASALNARLATLAPEPASESASEPVPETSAPPAPFDDEEPAPFPLAEAPPAHDLDAADEPVAEAPLQSQSQTFEPLEPEAPPFPGVQPLPPTQAEPSEAPFPHAVAPEAGPEAFEPAAHAGFVEEAHPSPAETRGAARSGWIIGLVGLVLFGLAIASMLGGKATAVNLGIGLLGVFALAYAGAELVLPWLHRSRDGD